MKNNIPKILGFLAIGAIFLAVFLSFRTGPERAVPAPGFSASVSQVFPSSPTESRVLIQAKDGGVWVNNFYKSAISAWPEMEAVLLAEASNYEIVYYKTNGSFELRLGARATPKDRATAEDSLSVLLGAGNSELCRLDIYVSIPYDLGDRQVIPLSFCGSVFK